MTQWINDINVEIQPTTGRRAPTKEQVIVDDKAFDQVSKGDLCQKVKGHMTYATYCPLSCWKPACWKMNFLVAEMNAI